MTNMPSALDKMKREHAESFRITELPSEEEARFLEFITNSDWYKEFASNYGGPPNLNDPDYDYRGAWREMGAEMFGFDPESGTIHGYGRAPSGKWLKSPQHPTIGRQYEEELLPLQRMAPQENTPLRQLYQRP